MSLSKGLDIAPLYTTHQSQLNMSYHVLPLLANCIPQLAIEVPITNCTTTQSTHTENRLVFLANKEAWQWK